MSYFTKLRKTICFSHFIIINIISIFIIINIISIIGTIGRVSTDNFTNISDQSISLLSSLSPISRQKEMETLGKGISDRTSQFSIDGQRLYNLINSNRYGKHVVTIDIKGNGSNYIPSGLWVRPKIISIQKEI
jgi:hypothetical protein